jgi:acetyltransferase
MIKELRFSKIFDGLRGDKPANMKILAKTLVDASKLPKKIKDLKEMDINPFIINDKSGKVVDARIVVG